MNQPPGTYVDRLLETLAAHPDREALIHGEQRISYTEARDLVLRIAAALADSGLRKGDGVALFTGNRAEVVLVQLAVHLIGCHLIFVPQSSPTARRLRWPWPNIRRLKSS